MESPSPLDSAARWVNQRAHADLPSEAERELRLAGLAWHREADAEAHLARAEALAPGHLAVLIAHYRYHFYKHHYEQARHFAEACLQAVGGQLGLPRAFEAVTSADANFRGDDPQVRFWLFGMQAYGYVLLRLGEADRGQAALQKIAALDVDDHTKTRVLLQVITQAGHEDDDA